MVTILATSSTYGRSKVVVRQDMDLTRVFAGINTKYVIKTDIDLGGKTVKIGQGSMLVFKGGSLANGTVVGNCTRVKAKNYEIFKRGYTRYRAYIVEGASKSSPPSLKKERHNCIIIEGSWDNKKCGPQWTGILNDSDEDVMLAVRNFVMLHTEDAKIKFPTFNALGYETMKFPGNRTIDFHNSTISYPDDLSVWEDEAIAIPQGAKACKMESGYGLITTSSNTTLKNLSVDGKSGKRQDETLRLGVSCIISIGDSKNVVIDNVSLSNILGPAMTAQKEAKDLTFKNCTFYNIGEHVMYSHQYKGYCHFEGCTFDTWDSERISVFRNGMDYVYKHIPPMDEGYVSYNDLYRFDLSFCCCTFNNPIRVSSQGRILGGFITSTFPIVVNVTDCIFTGAQPPLNPGGGASVSEKSEKNFKIFVRGCDGAPYVYASKNNYNVVMEFYDCINIPFRTVYAKRYENCKLYLDLYEDNMENVSPTFEKEFSEPLVVKNCEFIDTGRDVQINHPVFHRPVLFEDCQFRGNHARKGNVPEVVTIKYEGLPKVEFQSCDVDLPTFRMVGGKEE